MSAKDEYAGIYNQCDYWCERCAFTRRCGNYRLGEQLKRRERRTPRTDTESRTEEESLDDVLAQARERLDAVSAERFDDLLSGDGMEPEGVPFEAFQAEEDALEKDVQAHFIVKAATTYMRAVAPWLKALVPEVKDLAERCVGQARFAPETGDPREELDDVEDGLDIVTWYHTLLPAKAHRMVSGLLELPHQAAWNDGSDVYGTAKLLLVSIDRSQGAWTQLLAHFPQQEAAIMGFMIRLDHLRRAIERDVPQARAFIRPGLDEGPG